ncbi:MAG: phosphatidylglycerol lysyltransferase domain-containing protein [Pseudomonadota bacterium]
MTDADQSLGSFRKTVFDRAPRFLSVLAFLAGALALVSAAIPSQIVTDKKQVFRVLAEAPSVALSIGGLALMVLSLGLARRLKTAWALTLLVAAHGIFATALLRPRLVELCVYVALFAVLLITRKSFFRRSSLFRMIVPRMWVLGTLFILAIASFAALLWVSHQSGFVEASFLDLLIDPELGTAARPIIIAGIALGFILFYFGIASPAWAKPDLAGLSDFQKLRQLLDQSDQARPDNLLAFVGDKSVHYGPDGEAVLAYMDYQGSRIAMGPPIGPRSAWQNTLRSFRVAAEHAGLRPALYSVPPDLLADLHDLDFTFEKIGENAILNLPDFTLSGRKREVIRRSRRKLAERQGATFDLSLPPHKQSVLNDLRHVSDLWLKENGGREKSFSLGRFDPRFLNHCPIGIVKIGGKIIAFGSLLVSPDKHWAGIDLMRYDPEHAVTNTMDFLLVELILWAKTEGYQRFDLAMAPLSGLVEEDVAPLFARIGNIVFERGERFYNFQGLRRFKQKFNPDWEPRYIAAPGYWTLPILLAQVAFLTNRHAPSDKDPEAETGKVAEA